MPVPLFLECAVRNLALVPSPAGLLLGGVGLLGEGVAVEGVSCCCLKAPKGGICGKVKLTKDQAPGC